MWVVRGTQALRAKLPAATPVSGSDGPSGLLGGWYGSLLRWRSPVVLLVNEASLLPVLLRLAPTKTLLARVPAAVGAVLGGIGIPAEVTARELDLWGGQVRVGPTASRSMTGMLVEFGKTADWWRGPEQPDLVALAVRLAGMPVNPLRDRHGFPDRETTALLGLPVPAPRRPATAAQPAAAPRASSPPPPAQPSTNKASAAGDRHQAAAGGSGMTAFGRLRRETPEAPPGPPRITFRSGSGDGVWTELAPLLAAEGIDLDHPPERAVLQAALDRAVEARNRALFTPTGARRTLAVSALSGIVTALEDGDDALAGQLLEQVVPESPGDQVAEVSAVMGLTLTLLDSWLGPGQRAVPAGLGAAVAAPAGQWTGGRAAVEILALARRGRSAASVGALIVGQGSPQTLAGAALAAHAVLHAWAARTGDTFQQIVADALR